MNRGIWRWLALDLIIFLVGLGLSSHIDKPYSDIEAAVGLAAAIILGGAIGLLLHLMRIQE